MISYTMLSPSLDNLCRNVLHVVHGAFGSFGHEERREMQTVRVIAGDEIEILKLPAPADEVLPQVPWGKYDVLFTPAFWAARVWLLQNQKRFSTFRLGSSLREEAAACVLGGYGIRAEIALAAFDRLRTRGLLVSGVAEAEIQQALFEPMLLGDRLVRYRFAKQRAERLAAVLTELDNVAYEDDRMLRMELLRLPGVGPKTASWIVRNHLGSDEVAILDIHVVRACVAARVFPRQVNLNRDYFDLEDRFLEFAVALDARPSVLDSVMWHHMRHIGHPDSLSH
jgi:thermostable 8-oxoguanine DNA glycosylase